MTDTGGIPDYADEDSTAYDESDRPRLVDSAAALPTDEPLGLDEEDESLEARLGREEPDVEPGAAAPVGRLVDPEDGDYADDEPDALGSDVGATEDESAEEAAIHLIPEDDDDLQ